MVLVQEWQVPLPQEPLAVWPLVESLQARREPVLLQTLGLEELAQLVGELVP